MRSLHRHPLKSALGEEIALARVTERGLDGDRVRALLDTATGRLVSAKNPRLWRALLTVAARTTPHGIRLLAADGRELDEAGLTALLGREVRAVDAPPPGAELERSVPEAVLDRGVEVDVPSTVHAFGGAAPPGTFFDFAPVHLVSTATLAALGADTGGGGPAEAARYRPNLVVDTPGERGFPENGWVGRELLIGDAVRLEVLAATPRCAVPTLAHGALPRDPEALRAAARLNRVEPLPGMGPMPCAGVYARVLAGGSVRRGDAVSLR
ncbi:MOSC domain-containing protein [Kitasatospora sp. DSM 101779]|uniref:MOSC domain-containing protein n=1 Tax=Kitasatospora sp. DSM 101779 TaxID=2853165 RepID=UPI0021D9A42E|nr:MOSC domain-containing protein [Kitasatospora sp. DSM 101779]MCU7822341.1 MOSC domain-containing protein [Kitasatospora sp. DSM 101779]